MLSPSQKNKSILTKSWNFQSKTFLGRLCQVIRAFSDRSLRAQSWRLARLMTNVHTSKFCKRHFAAKIPFVLPGSGSTVFAQSPTKDDTSLVMRMVPPLSLQDIIAEFMIDRPSLCLIIREFVYLVFNKNLSRKLFCSIDEGFTSFYSLLVFWKGYFAVILPLTLTATMTMMTGWTMKTQPESEVGSRCAVLPSAIQESLAIHWYTHSTAGASHTIPNTYICPIQGAP